MGLFDKKTCDFCGEKIGLLGNKKLEDGNMCRACAAKLSPWFSERRHSTKAEIGAQLNYREENRKAVAAFRPSRSIGKYTRLLLDENARRFTVTASRDLSEANPDILDYSQALGCELTIDENRNELKQTDRDGRLVSYNPPRYEYSYNFKVTIRVDHPFFDEISYSLSNGFFKTVTRMGAGAPVGWNFKTSTPRFLNRENDYYEYMNLGSQIKEAVDGMRQEIRLGTPREAAPETVTRSAPAAVVCPCCTAVTVPDAQGCCEYCGSKLR